MLWVGCVVGANVAIVVDVAVVTTIVAASCSHLSARLGVLDIHLTRNIQLRCSSWGLVWVMCIYSG